MSQRFHPLAYFATLAFLISFSLPLKAQEATPSHVFQVVSTLNNHLALMHEYNESNPKKLDDTNSMVKMKPRHVFQNARMVFRKVQILKFLNGLDVSPLPALPDREINPGDVKKISAQILSEIQELNEIFGIQTSAAEVGFVEGKKPHDVYSQLTLASHQIEALGLPSVIPNEVYQVAMEVHQAISELATMRGSLVREVTYNSQGKKPNDVFDLTHQLFGTLQNKTTTVLNVEIPGGFVIPPARSGKATPKDVIFLMNQLLGELHSVLAASGGKTQLKQFPEQFGKTPSHVYDAVIASYIMLANLS